MRNTGINVALLCVLAVSLLAHTLPDDAPEESPADRYRAKVEEYRLAQIALYETELKSSTAHLRKKHGRVPKWGSTSGLTRADRELLWRHHQLITMLGDLRKGETGNLTVSFSFEEPTPYDVGTLHRTYARFTSYSFVVEEILPDNEFRMSCTKHRRSGSQGKPLEEHEPVHVRDFIVTGLDTKNLIAGEPLPFRLLVQPYHVLGVRDNAFFVLHAIETETHWAETEP